MSGETDNQLGEQVVSKWCCNIPPPPLESLGARSLAGVTRPGQCLVRSPLVVMRRIAFHFFEFRSRVVVFSGDCRSSGSFRFFLRIVLFRRFVLAFVFVLPAPFHDLSRSNSSLAASLSRCLFSAHSVLFILLLLFPLFFCFASLVSLLLWGFVAMALTRSGVCLAAAIALFLALTWTVWGQPTGDTSRTVSGLIRQDLRSESFLVNQQPCPLFVVLASVGRQRGEYSDRWKSSVGVRDGGFGGCWSSLRILRCCARGAGCARRRIA